MKGYGLINNQSCQYGIIILNVNTDDIIITTDNLNILNGEIIGFTSSSIRSQANLYNAQITYLNLYGIYGISDGIELDQNSNSHITIGSNWFITNHYAFNGGCSDSCKFYDNEIKHSSDGIILYNYSFDVQRNLFGYTIRNQSSCFQEDYPSIGGITLYNCHNSTIKNNDIMAQNGINIDAISTGNTIRDNVFRTFYNYNPIITFGSGTSSNVFCNNLLISSKPHLIWLNGENTCYWATNTTNAKNIVVDLDTNTKTDLCTSDCSANWWCQNKNRVYINSTCAITESVTCEYSCENGIYGAYCIGNEITPTTTTTLPSQITNVSWYTPVINQTDLNDASLQWLTPFVSPFFLILATTMTFCAVLTGVTKSPIVFPLSLLGFTLIFWYYQILPNIVAILLVLLEAIGSATLFKNQVSK
jgi:hypothetical protein